MRVLLATVPALTFIVLAVMVSNGWIPVHGTRYESFGYRSTIELDRSANLRIEHRHPDYAWQPADVYLTGGTATFDVAGRGMWRYRNNRPVYGGQPDRVEVTTPAARVESTAEQGARFTIDVQPGETTVVCTRCPHGVTVRSRAGRTYPVADGATVVVPMLAGGGTPQ